MDYNEMDFLVADLEDENKRLREALRAIAFPLQYMSEQAEKEGLKLNGAMAAQLAESPAYLIGIAKEALAK
jgi:hypothetical protein